MFGDLCETIGLDDTLLYLTDHCDQPVAAQTIIEARDCPYQSDVLD
jgi:hypothetical protein